MGTMQMGWTADEPLSFKLLSTCLDAGINFIDTADIYSRWVPGNPGGVSETIIGRWMKKARIPRDRVVIATKVRGRMGDGPDDEGLSRAHIMKAVDASLQRLDTEYIDLYQTHWDDEDVPVEETLTALDELVRQGKVHHIGCSNFPAARLRQSADVSAKRKIARYDTLQPKYSIVERGGFEGEVADTCRELGIRVIPYSPLAEGFLTGKYRRDRTEDSVRLGGVRRYFTDSNWQLLDRLEAAGRAKGGQTISQMALAWVLSHPLVTSAIIGPRTGDQLRDNLAAAEIRLSPEEKKTLSGSI